MPSTPKPRARSERRGEISEPGDLDPLKEVLAEFPDRLRGDPWKPAVDIFETEHELIVRLEMPGVRGKNLRVNVQADSLRVRGLRETPDASGVQRLHQMEIACGPFETHVNLGVPFDRDGVSAHLEDGLLEVRLPKRRAVRVEVETE
jgi:HSP20 family protein